MKILCKKWVGNDFDVHVDVDDNTRCGDLTIFREGAKSDDFSGGDEKGKKGRFYGF